MNRKTGLFSLTVLIGVAFTLIALAVSAQARPLSELHVCTSGCTYTDVQTAVDAAHDGDVIKIASGVYTEATPLSQMVAITKSLTLRGGYNPPDWTVSNPAIYTTTLDAQGNGRVMYIDGSAITGSITVTVDGLQLTGGTWSNTEYVNNYWAAPAGGGVRVQSANVIMLNSRLYANHTFNGLGSGLFQQYGSFTLQNSIVQENSGTGGIYSPLYGEFGGGLFLLQTTASISNSFILSNSAGYGSINLSECPYGGGIYLNSSTATIDHTLFQGNVAAQNEYGRGGGLASESGSVTISNSTILNNMASQSHSSSMGGGFYLSPYSNGASVLTGNLFQDNVDGALVVYNGLMTVTANIFQGNSGGKSVAVNFAGGAYLNGSGVFQNNTVMSNTAPIGGGATLNGSLAVLGNTFQGNIATGDGGGLVANGTVTLIRNVIQNNTAGGCGGGLLSNGVALEDGDILRYNTAWYGGGLCIKATTNGTNYQNLVVLDNQGSVNGSGVYIDRGTNPGTINLRHFTIGRNLGGDGAGVFVNKGGVSFANTIIYSQTVGAQNVSGTPSFSHTLRYQVLTPTLGTVSDLFAITGDPSFMSDGYHFTQDSAAIDVGGTTSVVDDADGNIRPQGSAPDLGAIESPYTHGVAAGMMASKQAGTPHWVMRWDPSGNASSMLFQQDYLIPFSYGGPITSPIISAYTVKDNFPAALQLSNQEATPAMSFSQAGNQLTWRSTSPFPAGSSGWIGVVGQSSNAQPGMNLNNSATLVYSLTNGQTTTLALQASSQVPARSLLPPLIVSPMNGEMCLDEQGRLQASGLTIAGMTVNLYENSSLKASTTADASGAFTVTWTSALTATTPLNSVNLYATICDPAQPTNCSAPSRSVHIDYPQANWCPQRSYWEGDVHNMHYVFHFRNDQGYYATNDFELPGVYGFANTQLHLYSCCDRDTNPFTVQADGYVYTTPVQHVGRLWTFNIGAAHDVMIQSQCQVGGTPPSHGVVLIDPDGFVFNQTKGGHYDQVTGMYSPTQSIAGITVTAYVSVPEWGGWVPWPAQMYNNQINPQRTGADGYFAFFTPPGSYYLQATGAGGYQLWRSPIIEVITQVAHANVPLTPWTSNSISQITLTPGGLNPTIITVPVGSSVEWLSSLGASPTITDLVRFTDNPVLRLLSGRNPLTDTLGFDGGALIPGQVYRRQFSRAGTYSYSDGAGRTAQVVVTTARVYLPLIRK